MPVIYRRTVKLAAFGGALLILLAVALVYGVLRASLPALDGTIVAPALGAAVTIERDKLGIPTVRAANRVDLAFGTGFVHGQDRFFQMDLSRRLAAGELSSSLAPWRSSRTRKRAYSVFATWHLPCSIRRRSSSARSLRPIHAV